MKRILAAFFLVHISLCFVSCENIEYLSNDRVVFEGFVKRRDGTPVQDINVYAYVYLDGPYGDTDKISFTKTDSEGHYLMIFPKPSNADDVALLVNTTNTYWYNDINSELTQFAVTDILPGDLDALYFDFGTVTLYSPEEITTLTVNFVSANSENTIYPLSDYDGLFPYRQRFYNLPVDSDTYPQIPGYQQYPDVPDMEPLPDGLHFYDYTLLEDGQTYSMTFDVLTNQEITLRYRNTENTLVYINIPIENQPVTYTVNY